MNKPKRPNLVSWIAVFLTIFYASLLAFLAINALQDSGTPDPEFPTAIIDTIYAAFALFAALVCFRTLAHFRTGTSETSRIKWLHLFAAIAWISLPFQGPPFSTMYWLISIGAVLMVALHGTVFWALNRS